MRFKVALVLPLLAIGSPSAIDVSVRADRVAVRSSAAPLADVLARFAQATGAELVYEASRPRQLVSVGIDAGSQAEALARLLEGQGLNYALRLGPNGRDIQLLVIGASTSTPAPSPSSSGFNRGRSQSPPEPEQDLAASDAEEPEPIVEEPPEPEPAPVQAVSPTGQTGFVSPGAGVDNRGGGGTSPYPPNPGGSMTPGPGPFQPPQLPQPASYPGPMAPRFPGPASFPGAQRY